MEIAENFSAMTPFPNDPISELLNRKAMTPKKLWTLLFLHLGRGNGGLGPKTVYKEGRGNCDSPMWGISAHVEACAHNDPLVSFLAP